MNKARVPLRLISTTSLVAAMTLPAVPALAQTTAPVAQSPVSAQESASALQPEGLEDIVVTAQKRSQNLQDVGISVTAFTSERLSQLGVTNATDIIKQTPGLNILSSSASSTNVNIRGVSQNDFADHLEGPIAVYADEGYLGASGVINSQVYDLDRVEVLRGPQGTLFGRNATGGLIHYISKRPTRDFEGYFRVDLGERNLRQFEGAVSGPISDTVQARLSVAGDHQDGYVKNLIGPTPANHNNYSARLQVAFDLSDKTKLNLMVNGNFNDGERGLAVSNAAAVADANGLGRFVGSNENVYGCPGCTLLGYRYPSSPFKREYNSPGTFKKDVFHAQAKLTTEIGAIDLTSITDYLYLKKNLPDEDNDSSPNALFSFSSFQNYNQYSEELRLSQDVGRFKWVAGAYFLKLDGKYATSVLFGAPLLGIAPINIFARNDYTVKTFSASGFAQGEYKISDAFTATLGARYTHDNKKADYTWFDNVGDPVARYNRNVDPSADRDFNNVSIKAELDWHPAEHTLVYASFSRGHKGGNWAFPVFPPPINASNFPAFPHKQEVLNDYEAGVKTEFLDRKIRLNLSGYYYDYHNYQAFSLRNLVQTIFNRDAMAYGGEAELTVAPTKGLEISLGAAGMDSKVYDLQFPTGVFYNAQLPFASHFSANGLIRYEWDALGGRVATQASFTSVGAHYFDVVNEPVTYQKRYTTVDARIEYTTGGGHWNVALWAKNLTNTTYRQYSLDISALGYAAQTYAPPRWIGGSIGYKF